MRTWSCTGFAMTMSTPWAIHSSSSSSRSHPVRTMTFTPGRCCLHAFATWRPLPGHGEIGEDDIEGAPAECLDGPQPVLDGGHDEATVPQLIAHELAEVPSILGEEHTEIRPRISHADTPPEDMDRT